MKKKLTIFLLVLIVLLMFSCSQATVTDVQEKSLDQGFVTENNAVTRGTTSSYATVKSSAALHDSRWGNSTSTTLDVQILKVKIIAYRIKWFSGSWSQWYVPGVNDLYKKYGENTRRVWACFNDHSFEYMYIPASYSGSVRSYSEYNRTYVPSTILSSGVKSLQAPKDNNTRWVNSLSINNDLAIKNHKIVAYRIKWFSGSWSGWFVPGYEDIYQKPGENARRWWACFNDHEYQYLYFTK